MNPAGLEPLVLPFADAATRIKQRMVEAGWSEQAAEDWVVAVTAPLIERALDYGNVVSVDFGKTPPLDDLIDIYEETPLFWPLLAAGVSTVLLLGMLVGGVLLLQAWLA